MECAHDLIQQQFDSASAPWLAPPWQGLGLQSGSTITLAVSGGSDSLGLLYLAKAWQAAHDVTIIAATVDHRLRTESADEAAYVANICRELGLRHDVLVWDAPQTSSKIAREARHKLLSEFAESHQSKCILLGHTANDQIETAFIRLHQGTGLYGLGGMDDWANSPFWMRDKNSVRLFRPLLNISRESLQAYLTSQKLSWIDDPSNENYSYLRPQIRALLSRYPNTRENMQSLVHFAQSYRRQNQVHMLRMLGYMDQDKDKLIFPRAGLSAPLLKLILQARSGKTHNVRHARAVRFLDELKRGTNFRTTLHGCKISARKNTISFLPEHLEVGPSILQTMTRLKETKTILAANTYFP